MLEVAEITKWIEMNREMQTRAHKYAFEVKTYAYLWRGNREILGVSSHKHTAGGL